MAQDENTFMDSANNLYFEDVENEDGKQLNLEESLKSNLAGIIEARYIASELAGILTKSVGLLLIIILGAYTLRM